MTLCGCGYLGKITKNANPNDSALSTMLWPSEPDKAGSHQILEGLPYSFTASQ